MPIHTNHDVTIGTVYTKGLQSTTAVAAVSLDGVQGKNDCS